MVRPVRVIGGGGFRGLIESSEPEGAEDGL